MIGKVIQRDETPSADEFFFVHDNTVSRGSFVQYKQNGDIVIARVSSVYRTNEYFENAESISEAMKGQDMEEKFPTEEWEVSLAKASIMGRFSNGIIKRVDNAPSPGHDIEKAEDTRITEFLGLDKNGLGMGEVMQQGIDASIQMTDFLQKHFAILAQSGAGKSYTASILLEELLDRDYAPSIVAVDPHGDYTNFADDPDYMQKTRVFTNQDIQIAVKDLSADQIAGFFSGMSGPQREELNSIMSKLGRGENNDYGLEDVIKRVERKEMNEKVKYALLRKLNQLKSMHIFGKVNKPSDKDIEPGKLNILDLSDMIDNQKKQIIAAFFARHFFKKRRQERIPPTLMLYEEAHNFAKDAAPSPSRSIIEKIAREGRKFNMSLGLISQRPVKLSTTALSQCNTQLIMRVTNPNDLEHISQSSEGITADVKQQIPSLKTGESIMIGEAVNYPTFINIRERRSKEPDSSHTLEEQLKNWEKEEKQMNQDAEAFM